MLAVPARGLARAGTLHPQAIAPPGDDPTMTKLEARLRILEAVAPIVAARSSTTDNDLDHWRNKMTLALDELFEHAQRLVFADKAVDDAKD